MRTYLRVYYEDMWSSYEKYREIVEHEQRKVNCWNGGNPVEMFKKKPKVSLAELKNWSKD